MHCEHIQIPTNQTKRKIVSCPHCAQGRSCVGLRGNGREKRRFMSRHKNTASSPLRKRSGESLGNGRLGAHRESRWLPFVLIMISFIWLGNEETHFTRNRSAWGSQTDIREPGPKFRALAEILVFCPYGYEIKAAQFSRTHYYFYDTYDFLLRDWITKTHCGDPVRCQPRRALKNA